MGKNKLRKIKVENQIYLWRREHFHLTEYKHSKCAEKVIIYLEGYKKSALQLLFREEDNLTFKIDIEKEKWCVGYPNDGVIWLFNSRKDLKPQTANIDINLNRPAVIAKLIQYYIQNSWYPEENKRTLIVEDALKLLDVLDFPNGINNKT